MVALAKRSAAFPGQEIEQVFRMMKQIRRTWTPEQREYRAELARQKQANLFRAFIRSACLASDAS